MCGEREREKRRRNSSKVKPLCTPGQENLSLGNCMKELWTDFRGQMIVLLHFH